MLQVSSNSHSGNATPCHDRNVWRGYQVSRLKSALEGALGHFQVENMSNLRAVFTVL
jgi:hypothetical protein